MVFTDNNPLTYVLQKAKLDAAGHRWIAALSCYDFAIHYRSGKANCDADGLSRLPCSNSVGFQEIQKETIQALCCAQLAQPYIETLCMSANDIVDDFDIHGDIIPQDWRSHQREDAVIGQFLRAVTNKVKPARTDVNSREGNTQLQ